MLVVRIGTASSVGRLPLGHLEQRGAQIRHLQSHLEPARRRRRRRRRLLLLRSLGPLGRLPLTRGGRGRLGCLCRRRFCCRRCCLLLPRSFDPLGRLSLGLGGRSGRSGRFVLGCLCRSRHLPTRHRRLYLLQLVNKSSIRSAAGDRLQLGGGRLLVVELHAPTQPGGQRVVGQDHLSPNDEASHHRGDAAKLGADLSVTPRAGG